MGKMRPKWYFTPRETASEETSSYSRTMDTFLGRSRLTVTPIKNRVPPWLSLAGIFSHRGQIKYEPLRFESLPFMDWTSTAHVHPSRASATNLTHRTHDSRTHRVFCSLLIGGSIVVLQGHTAQRVMHPYLYMQLCDSVISLCKVLSLRQGTLPPLCEGQLSSLCKGQGRERNVKGQV